jgi:hypothetical protein
VKLPSYVPRMWSRGRGTSHAHVDAASALHSRVKLISLTHHGFALLYGGLKKKKAVVMRPPPLSAALFRRPCVRNVWPSDTLILRHVLQATRTAPHRGYASESTTPQGSLKPKAHTSLRRTAFDSLSIRANPKPTQSEIQPISTLATSERYLLTRLRTRLPPTARPLHDAYWVPKWSSSGGEGDGEGAGAVAGAARREGEVFVFSNGSFVCWGLGEEDARRFRRDVLIPARAEVGPLAEPETEELEFATDPSECVFSFIIYFSPPSVYRLC